MAGTSEMKYTEVGLIPRDWEICNVGGEFSFLRNNSLSRDQLNSAGGAVKNVHYGDVLIRYGEVLNADKVFIPFINDNVDIVLSPKNLLQNGDVVFADTAEDEAAGKATEIYGIGGQKVVAGLHTMPIRPINRTFAKGFLGYSFNAAYYHDQLKVFMQGTKVISISKKALQETFLVFPTYMDEQKKIVDTLGSIDTLILDLEKAIVKKRLMKQGSMQQLLSGKVRLKGFSKPWNEMELGQLADIKRGSMLKSSEYQFGTIPVIAGGITPAGYHNVANRTGRTITVSASGANAGYVSMHVGPIFATDCSTISEAKDKSYYIDFVYQYLVLHQQDIFRAQTGGAQPHIHPKDISSMKIEVPDYDEQFKIATYLSTMDKEIAALEAERDKYKNIKQGMMQKLLTGQIRLPV